MQAKAGVEVLPPAIAHFWQASKGRRFQMSESKAQTWDEIQKDEYKKGEPGEINFLKNIGLTQICMDKYYEEA